MGLRDRGRRPRSYRSSCVTREIHPRLRRLQYLDFCNGVRRWDDLVRELESLKTEKVIRWSPPRDAPPVIHRAVLDLDSGNQSDRRGAVDVLVEADSEASDRPALCHALTHPFRDVRGRATAELATLKDEAVPTSECLRGLKDVLLVHWERGDVTPGEAKAALVGLGRIAFPLLAETSRRLDDPSRLQATGLLADTGASEAVPVLCELIEDANPNVACSAIHQAVHLKVKEAVPILLRVVLDDSTTAQELRNANTYSERAVAAAARALIKIAERSIETRLIEATLHRLPQIRMYAAQILGGIGGPGAVTALAKLLDDTELAPYTFWGEQFSSKFAVHEVAAKSLDEIGTDDAIALLRQYRRRHPLREDSEYPRLSID